MGAEYGVLWLVAAFLLVAGIFAVGAWLEHRRARSEQSYEEALADLRRGCEETQAAIGAALLPSLEKMCAAVSAWLERERGA